MPYIPSGSEVINTVETVERIGVKEGMTVVDLGCGTQGHFVFPAARMVGQKGIVYAVDILKSALAGVQSRAKLEVATNIKTIWADIELLGAVKISEADVVMLINNSPREPMLREAARITRRGGRLAVIDWKSGATSFGPPTKDRVPKEWIKDILARMRFRLIDDFVAGPYHYGLVFVKE